MCTITYTPHKTYTHTHVHAHTNTKYKTIDYTATTSNATYKSNTNNNTDITIYDITNSLATTDAATHIDTTNWCVDYKDADKYE